LTTGKVNLAGLFQSKKKAIGNDVNEQVTSEILRDIRVYLKHHEKESKKFHGKQIRKGFANLECLKEVLAEILNNIKPEEKDLYVQNYKRVIQQVKNQIINNYHYLINKTPEYLDEIVNISENSTLRNLIPILNVQIELWAKIYNTVYQLQTEPVDQPAKLLTPLIMEKQKFKELLDLENQVIESIFTKVIDDAIQKKQIIKEFDALLRSEIKSKFSKVKTD
jgi:hypothetical protein